MMRQGSVTSDAQILQAVDAIRQQVQQATRCETLWLNFSSQPIIES